jgi:serine/threonine protein kinase
MTRANFKENRLHFTDRIARRAMRDIISGVAHLHRYGVSHRDLKCDNVFINGRGNFVIGDFGAALIIQSNNRIVGDNFIHNVEYNPPEVDINKKADNLDLENTAKIDIWALGTILIALISAIGIWRSPCRKFGVTKELLDKDINNSKPQVIFIIIYAT